MANPNTGAFFSGTPGRTPGSNTQDLYVVSGVVTGQNLVLTLSNSTTVTIALTSIFTAIDAEDITGVAFNTSSRVLTVNQGGRSFSATIPDTVIPPQDNFYVTSGSYSTTDDTITLTRNDGNTVSIDLSALVAQIVDDTNTYVTSMGISGANLQLTRNDNVVVQTDISSLQNSNVSLTGLVPGTPTAGEIPYYTGTAWEFRTLPDSDTTYTAGAGINISDSEVISVGDTEVTNAMLAGDIAISKLDTDGTLVTINTVAMSPGGSYTITAGPAPVFPNHLNASWSPNQVEFAGSGTTQSTLTLSVPSGYSIQSATVTAQDPAGHPYTVTTVSTTQYRIQVDRTHLGTHSATVAATVRRTSDDSDIVLHATPTILVERGWYSSFGTTVPTNVSGMTDEGIWHSGDTVDLDAPAGTNPTAYLALPIHAAGYTFRSGIAFLTFTAASGTFDTNWTLYSSTEFSHFTEGEEITITVTEN